MQTRRPGDAARRAVVSTTLKLVMIADAGHRHGTVR